MKVVLRSDLEGLGLKGDVCEVADGYARNYLLPRGLALKASKGAEAQATVMRRSRDVKDATARSAAQEVASKLVPTVIYISAKAGGEGKLFGSVTAQDIVDAVAAQTSIDVDRRDLQLDEPIKAVGTHSVVAKLHREVEFPITVEVAPV